MLEEVQPLFVSQTVIASPNIYKYQTIWCWVCVNSLQKHQIVIGCWQTSFDKPESRVYKLFVEFCTILWVSHPLQVCHSHNKHLNGNKLQRKNLRLHLKINYTDQKKQTGFVNSSGTTNLLWNPAKKDARTLANNAAAANCWDTGGSRFIRMWIIWIPS